MEPYSNLFLSRYSGLTGGSIKKIDKSQEEPEDLLSKELRRSIRTVEVIGSIIRNRAGSLEKDKLENLFQEGMCLHLRILSSFLEIIKHQEQQQGIVEFIKSRLQIVVEKRSKGKSIAEVSHAELEKLSRKIFWGMNFSVVFGLINKVVHSLGSEKLQIVVDKVCNKINTPASFLVKHGIYMWYNKNLQIDIVASQIKDDGFSKTAEEIMKFMIVNHCSIHQIGFQEQQKIENKFGIPSKRLLVAPDKG